MDLQIGLESLYPSPHYGGVHAVAVAHGGVPCWSSSLPCSSCLSIQEWQQLAIAQACCSQWNWKQYARSKDINCVVLSEVVHIHYQWKPMPVSFSLVYYVVNHGIVSLSWRSLLCRMSTSPDSLCNFPWHIPTPPEGMLLEPINSLVWLEFMSWHRCLPRYGGSSEGSFAVFSSYYVQAIHKGRYTKKQQKFVHLIRSLF